MWPSLARWKDTKPASEGEFYLLSTSPKPEDSDGALETKMLLLLYR
jgi:hypothetical protein